MKETQYVFILHRRFRGFCSVENFAVSRPQAPVRAPLVRDPATAVRNSSPSLSPSLLTYHGALVACWTAKHRSEHQTLGDSQRHASAISSRRSCPYLHRLRTCVLSTVKVPQALCRLLWFFDFIPHGRCSLESRTPQMVFASTDSHYGSRARICRGISDKPRYPRLIHSLCEGGTCR